VFRRTGPIPPAVAQFVPSVCQKKRKAQQKQTERKKTKERKTKDKKRTRDDPFGNFCSQLFRARIMPFSSFAFIFPFSVLIRTCDQQHL
jgi:hypothetical protein